MLRHAALAGLLIAGTAVVASANGRAPQTSTITFRRGNDQHVIAGGTFGAMFSADGGATWFWMCEKAIRYGGNYDPDYAYTSSGAMFATTFDGALVNRSGCQFDPTSLGNKFVSAIELGPDGSLFMAASHVATPSTGDPGDSRILKSTDDGLTFSTTAMPGQVGDWWSSLEVAPSDPQRVYLTGYRVMQTTRTFLAFRSDDGGASFQPMSTTGLQTTRDSTIDIVGISKTDPDRVYARVTYQTLGAVSDGLYRSTDGGQTWQAVFSKSDEIYFLVRANGDLLVGTRNSGLFVSRAPSNGDAWTEVAGSPTANCLVENEAGEVWACTPNWGIEDAGIMKTTDLATWTKVLRYQDLDGPVACPPGTLQRDLCVDEQPSIWCGLRDQFGIAANPTSCPLLFDDPAPDGPSTPPEKGCCQTGHAATPSPMAMAMAIAVGLLLVRRRRAPR